MYALSLSMAVITKNPIDQGIQVTSTKSNKFPKNYEFLVTSLGNSEKFNRSDAKSKNIRF